MSSKSFFQLVISLIFFIISAIFIASSSSMYGNVCQTSQYEFDGESYYDSNFKLILILVVVGFLALLISIVILHFTVIAKKQKSYFIFAFLFIFIFICLYTAHTSYDSSYKQFIDSPIGNHCKVEILGSPLIKYFFGFIVSIWGSAYYLIKTNQK